MLNYWIRLQSPGWTTFSSTAGDSDGVGPWCSFSTIQFPLLPPEPMGKTPLTPLGRLDGNFSFSSGESPYAVAK
jgi:hypothetical protein